jgi:hypothetical protein
LNVYLRKTVRKARPIVFKRSKHAEVCEANGSVEAYLNGLLHQDLIQGKDEVLNQSYLLSF